MKIDNISLAELKEKLVRGSPGKIQKRLKSKGIDYTRQYISRCLDPDHPSHNEVIIEEAVHMVEEQAVNMSKMRKRIGKLKYAL